MFDIFSDPLFKLLLLAAISWVFLSLGYFYFKKNRGSASETLEELIAYKKPYNIFIVFSEEDLENRVALSDMVIRYKDIIENSYKVPDKLKLVKSEERELTEPDLISKKIKEEIKEEPGEIPIEYLGEEDMGESSGEDKGDMLDVQMEIFDLEEEGTINEESEEVDLKEAGRENLI